ncbi:MAG TPA: DUF4476 domain-containing protein [Chitinophagales bacterium]|nr:DUF4476 domain-containing protein [Chitinophagales bacterium]
MKTKLLLPAFFSVAIVTGAFSNHTRTALSLRMFDGRPVSVLVDGVPHGGLCIQHEILNLSPGIHRLKVFAVQHHPFGWQGRMTPVFRGNVEILEGYEVIAVIRHFNTLVIEDYQALYVPPVTPPCPAPGYLPGYLPFPPNNGFYGTTCENRNTGTGWNDWNNPCSYSGWGYKMPMNQHDFTQLLRVLESKSFESTRQEIALSALGSNYFTSEQVRQMLNVFSFESTKTEVAKRAYDKVVDPDRFYIVFDSFTFESSIDDLLVSLGK